MNNKVEMNFVSGQALAKLFLSTLSGPAVDGNRVAWMSAAAVVVQDGDVSVLSGFSCVAAWMRISLLALRIGCTVLSCGWAWRVALTCAEFDDGRAVRSRWTAWLWSTHWWWCSCRRMTMRLSFRPSQVLRMSLADGCHRLPCSASHDKSIRTNLWFSFTSLFHYPTTSSIVVVVVVDSMWWVWFLPAFTCRNLDLLWIVRRMTDIIFAVRQGRHGFTLGFGAARGLFFSP